MLESVDILGINVVDNIFNKEECDRIIDYHKEWESELGTTFFIKENKSTDEKYREVTLYNPQKNIVMSGKINWILDAIMKAIHSSNEHYKFDIKGIIEYPNIMKYNAPSGKYDYHLDIGSEKPYCWRKLSYTIMLNDNYKGGMLEFASTEETGASFPNETGKMIIFPSFLRHRVTTITEGIRWALVGWISGNSFK